MADKISGAQAKVERADKHIKELQDALLAFHDTKPYKVASQRDPNTRELIYYMAEVADIPLPIAAIAGDALQNLRSALDYLAHAFVAKPTRDTAYPIYDPAKEGTQAEKSYLAGKIHGMTPEAKKIVAGFKPHKGGDETLWHLHELNRFEKHRLLVAVAASLQSFNVAQHIAASQQGHYLPSAGASIRVRRSATGGTVVSYMKDVFVPPKERFCPLKAGNVLFADAPDAEVNENIDFRFGVAFNEPAIFECDSITKTLYKMYDLVVEIVAAFAKLA
jgi:hypothetical protein